MNDNIEVSQFDNSITHKSDIFNLSASNNRKDIEEPQPQPQRPKNEKNRKNSKSPHKDQY